MKVDLTALDKLMRLARLSLPVSGENAGKRNKDRLVADLNEVLALIEQMNSVDTKKISPMAHPLDIVQPLRGDQDDRSIDRARFQEEAPDSREGFYLVPRVIEKDGDG